MTRKTILTLGALAAGTLLGAAALAASGDRGPGAGQMMMGHHGGGMMTAPDGSGMGRQGRDGQTMGMARQGRQGGGSARLGALAETPAFQDFDTDGDGTVTLEEARAGAEALHASHDADGDGGLTDAEFEDLFAEIARGMASRPFARLDVDGDGRLSPEELALPAQMMARRMLMQSREGRTAPE
ncbi:EF-hand domain-containing protein [Rhodosalinus sp.]|uniref:EF-hand domain-containing protein n=1 Tax=Rhodosalinus sp. TaxID=2047741 RepID=UPI0035663DEB